jgi:hypothetical protein
MPHRPQSSSASRFTAGASGFFILSQSGERPERWGEPLSHDHAIFEHVVVVLVPANRRAFEDQRRGHRLSPNGGGIVVTEP